MPSISGRDRACFAQFVLSSLSKDRALSTRCPCPNSKADSHTVRQFGKLTVPSEVEGQAHRPEQSRRKGCPYELLNSSAHMECLPLGRLLVKLKELLKRKKTYQQDRHSVWVFQRLSIVVSVKNAK